jgi:biotin/methionine sulfoxide reductase
MHLFGTHFGTYEVVRDAAGQPQLSGFALDPRPSRVGAAYLDLARHPQRVLEPMVRRGWLAARERPDDPARGSGRGRDDFVPMSWDEAARLVAGEIERVQSRYSNEAIFGGSYGWASAGRFHHAQGQLKRFLNLCGGFVASVNTYSYGAAAVLLPHVIGAGFKGATDTAPTWDQIVANARLIICFGGLRPSNAQVEAGGTGQHRAEAWLERALVAGIRVVILSPSGNDAPPGASGRVDHIAIRPNTDCAVMLAMAQTLWAERRHDAGFLARHTIGFEEFAAYLDGRTDGIVKDAEWAQGISGVPAATILELARAYADEPALINVSWSLQRARHGEQPYWAAITLSAIAGQAGRAGCGFAFGLTAVSSVGQPIRRLKGLSFDQGRNPVSAFIPVARITELLTDPGGTIDYNGQRLRLPDIRLVYWAGGNPFHHHQDLNRLAQAFRRPQTVIVNESMWTATARHADIVLPARFPFERNDIAASSRDNWLIASGQIMAPPRQVKSDHDIFSTIADEMGLRDAFAGGRSETEWLCWLYDGYRASHQELPDFETFWAQGYAALDLGEEAPVPSTPLEDFVRDPAAHRLATPSGRIEIVSQTIRSFGYADCPAHASWLAPEEWLGAPLAETYPLHLLSPQPAHRLHSQLEHATPSQSAKVRGREVALMNPADAERRALRDDDVVEIFNARGCCLAALRIDPHIQPGTVILPTGAWFQPGVTADGGMIDVGGNPNVLTSIRPTSALSQATAPNSCLVDVRRTSSELI